MGIIKLTSRHPAEPDPEGWDEMTPEEQKRWITEHHPERAARINNQHKAMAATRQRIKELEANLSPEAKSQWNEMCGRGKTDPQLEEWKRERILIEAMMSGEVLPSSSWRLQGFPQRLAELDEWICYAEGCRASKQAKDEELQAIEILLRQQDALSSSLLVLHRLAPSVRDDIATRMTALHNEWQRWKDGWQERKDGKGRRPQSLAEIVKFVRHNIAVYSEMLNTYARMPVPKGADEQYGELLHMMTKMMESQNEERNGINILLKGKNKESPVASSLRLMKETIGDIQKRCDTLQDTANETRNIAALTAANMPTIKDLVHIRNGNCDRKPKNTIPMKDAVATMRRICKENAVDAKQLKRWVTAGRASKVNIPISWVQFASPTTWIAWCESYRDAMTDSLKSRTSFHDAIHGKVDAEIDTKYPTRS